MNSGEITDLDRELARVCESCPVCRHARKKQRGAAFWLVRTVEGSICPFCRAYERGHGRKSHEPHHLREGKKMKMKNFGEMWLQFHLERPSAIMKQQAAAMGGMKRAIIRK